MTASSTQVIIRNGVEVELWFSIKLTKFLKSCPQYFGKMKFPSKRLKKKKLKKLKKCFATKRNNSFFSCITQEMINSHQSLHLHSYIHKPTLKVSSTKLQLAIILLFTHWLRNIRLSGNLSCIGKFSTSI
jgi:hypothetical protein